MFSLQLDTCKTELENKISEEDLGNCKEFIEARKEARHYKTMIRQKQKLERLCHRNSSERGGCSNIHGDHTCTNTENLGISPSNNTCITNTNNKWVINISSKPLTQAQEKLLAHGPNYTQVPRSPPITEYIAAIEQVCSKLKPGEAEELRGEVKAIIKRSCNPPNITREEWKAVKELKEDKSRMVLTADKGVALVVMDTADYKKKSKDLLQQPTYQPIPTDPTSKYKNKLINMLKSIKAEGGISEAVYKKLYPTGAGSPKFHGLPKKHKEGLPLRPIVSSIGAVTYHTAKELARILKPLVGRSPYHIQNSLDFIQQIQGIQLQPNQCMVSFDVKALFTSVPVQPAISIIKKLLEKDQTLQQRTTMSVNNISCLLEFCLMSTYFTYQGQHFQQLEGAAMGSPISPIVANLFMDDFEERAISTSPHPPSFWKRYVDDTFTILESSHRRAFLDHINSVDQHIQFTCEEQREDGSLPFLDVLVMPQEDGSLKSTVFRKPTHTDLYLRWDSHHTLPSKYSVIGTLLHRAKTICSDPQLLKQEEDHLYKALSTCKYPTWALNRIKMKIRNPTNKKNNNSNPKNSGTDTNQKPYIIVPYQKGLSEIFKNICNNHGVQVYFKGGKTIKNLLMAPKDQDPMKNRSGVIYRFKCNRVECDDEYIGESSRTFGEGFKEHLKAPSPIFDHLTTTGHQVSLENFSIVGERGAGPHESYQRSSIHKGQ